MIFLINQRWTVGCVAFAGTLLATSYGLRLSGLERNRLPTSDQIRESPRTLVTAVSTIWSHFREGDTLKKLALTVSMGIIGLAAYWGSGKLGMMFTARFLPATATFGFEILRSTTAMFFQFVVGTPLLIIGGKAFLVAIGSEKTWANLIKV